MIGENRAQLALIGFRYDENSSFMKGAADAPSQIRAALRSEAWNLSSENGTELDSVFFDAGDVEPQPSGDMFSLIENSVGTLISDGLAPISLGGDHSITYPSAAAVARAVWPRSLGVIHFDAHADTGADQWGNLHAHGQPMRRLIDEGWVAGKNFVQIGLRGYWPDRDTFEWMREQGMRWHAMTEIEERGSEAVLADAIVEALDGPEVIYLSVDIDVVDPGMAPATGTPEAGGMLARELLRAVRQIVSQVELVGMDVVEVSPPYDHAEVTAILAHRTVMEAISALGARRR